MRPHAVNVNHGASPRARGVLSARLRKALRRGLAALTVGLLGVSGLMISGLPPAHAALYNIFPADADGTPQGVFYADSALFATMTSDTTGGNVCIVDAEVTDPSAANCASSFAWGKPQTYVGIGTLLGYPLEAPPLAVGKWRLLTTDVSGKTGTELSEVFEVRPCAAECDETAAQSQLAPWKAKAATAMDTVESLDYIGAADKAMSMHNKLASVLTDVVKGGGPVGVLMGIGVGMIEGMFANPWDSQKDLAMSILRPLHATSYRMWAGIAQDPPRFDYDIDTQPEFVPPLELAADDFAPALTTAQLEVMHSYVQLTGEAAAYGDASRLANERYQGAIEDADYEAAAAQAEAASRFTFALNQRLRGLQTIQPQVSAMPWAQQPVFADPAALFEIPEGQTVSEVWAEVLASAKATFSGGISGEDRDYLRTCAFYGTAPSACEITDEMIDYSVSLWQNEQWVEGWESFDISATPAQVLDEYTAQLDDTITAYDLFGRWIALKSGEAKVLIPGAEPNRAPASSFTQTVEQGEAPLTVEFTSTATDPDGDELSLRWDIAGERYVDDQQAVTHTFTEPGTYWIGLTATDPEGLWHQAVSKVEVYPSGEQPTDNRAPVASFTPQTVDKAGPFEETFTSTSTDPDGDELTHTWYFGDGTSYTGETVTKTFEPGYLMSVLLIVSDGQLTSQASGEVTSRCADCGTENSAPVPSFTMDPETGAAPLDVDFEATSTDADGDQLTHTWHFGDGETATGDTASHRYDQPGSYTATLVASDGTASVSITRTITVQQAAEPLAAGFTTGKSYDAASALNGAAMLDTGVEQLPNYPATNLIVPGSEWRTPNSQAGEQSLIVRLAGEGRDLIDRVQLTGFSTNTSVRHFSVALTDSNTPDGSYDTVLDHAELAQATGAQTFAFAPRTATFLKLTVHDNHGGNYLRLAGLAALSVEREGGIVSLDSGVPATATANSEYSANYLAANVLFANNNYWSTPLGTTTDQTLRVMLGGDGPHELDRLVLRGIDSARSLQDFELWVSDTGDEGSFTRVLEGTLARNTTLQEFSFAPTSAAAIELRMKNNHGDASYLYLYELRAITTNGLNVADGTGVGAQIVDVSGYTGGWPPERAIAHSSTGNGWIGEAGAVTDQHLTVLLRNGDPHLIDRVVITPGAYRAKNVEVQVSNDGTAFTPVATRQLFNNTADHTITFAPVQARFVRLNLLDGYHSTYLGVQRLRVFSPERGGAAVPFADTSTGNPVAWAWDFGDGTTSPEQHPQHHFAGAGTYEVSLTVTDVDGSTDTFTGNYTVPELPTIGLDAPSYTANEGAYVPLTASGGAVQQWDWDLDYTKPSTTGSTQSAYFPDQGSYTVSVRGLSADWLWTPMITKEFTVLNVAPTVNPGAPVSGLVLDPLTPVVLTLSDPRDALTCTWNWGDGSAPQTVEACTSLNSRVPHTYALPGTYTATLTADDGDGGVTSATLAFTALHRSSFMQVTEAMPVGDDLQITVKLLDGPRGWALAGQEVEISAGGVTQTATSADDGAATVVLPGAAAADALRAEFAGSPTHLSSEIDRAVRAPRADIVFMVDESGSMGGYQDRIKQRIRDIAEGLGTHLDYRMGLTGFADDYRDWSRSRVLSPLSAEMEDFFTAVHGLQATWGSAYGYHAAVRAIDDLDYRPGAASCLVLVTDEHVLEPATAFPETYEDALEALRSQHATFFSIISSHQATEDAYGAGPGLAGATGGESWSLNEFLNDASGVLDSLVEKCVTVATTPDLGVTVAAPDAVTGAEEFTSTVTVTNLATVYTPGVVLTADIPAGLEIVSVSDGGTFNAAIRQISWPAFDSEVGASAPRSIVLRAVTTGLDPGSYPFEIDAKVSYDGSLGDESDTANNSFTKQVTVAIPEPDKTYDVSLASSVPSTVEAGENFTYTLTASDNGEANSGLTVLQRLPERVEIIDVAMPTGWVNPHGEVLSGAHPDGITPGEWLVLQADELDGGAEFTVTARVTPTPPPTVIDDEGELDASLPALAGGAIDEITIDACVSAHLNEITENDCVSNEVPVKEIVAEVTVRLAGGITHLIVSVDVSEALEGDPVTLAWQPSSALATPSSFFMTDLEPGTHHFVRWPGASFDGAGAVTKWPGWRAVTEADFDAEGYVLDPVTGLAMTEQQQVDAFRGDLILDPALPETPWRSASTLTFSANPSVSAVVNYREVVPHTDRVPEPEPEPGITPKPDPDPTPGAQPDAKPSDAPGLVSTGSDASATQALVWLALATVLLGAVLLRRHRNQGLSGRRGPAVQHHSTRRE